MNGFATFVISSGSLMLLSFTIGWYQNKRRKAEFVLKQKQLQNEVLSGSDVSWKKVGRVKEIYFYPLKSGKGKQLRQCKFEEYGISVDEPGMLSMKDRMFLVYHEPTGKFTTARQHPKLVLISIAAVSENEVKLEVNGVPPLIFRIPKSTDKNAKLVQCSMWFGEPVECLDCGSEANQWLSKFLLGSESSLRLGMCLFKGHRNVVTGVWKKLAKIYNTLRNEDTGLFSDLSSYMLLSESSVDDLNERLEKPIPPLQLRPNILVEGCSPYAEDEWEWIKVGNDAIIRNVKLCTRCSMVNVDPDTGISNLQLGPLKTLKTYRKLKDPEIDALENHAPSIGIYCGLYRLGSVRVGDDISVYQAN